MSAGGAVHRHLFDDEDRALLDVVNPVVSGEKSSALLRNLLDPCFHPRGIKELAAPRALRIACALLDLLSSLERAGAAEHLRALRAVRDEVLHNGNPTLTRNTARVLLQIMKELVRAHGDERRQLELAHDFRQAVTGNPRFIRRQLRAYHLLEMPEDWSQMAFDHHVHDASSKGRKSPTHLVMDAWIKGVRTLGVVYYHFVHRASAAELLEAAEIMGLRVRVGVEFSARVHDAKARIIWAPRGFKSREDFVAFLEQPEVRRLMEQGKAIAEHKTRLLLERLRVFNETQLGQLNDSYGLAAPALAQDAFLAFVGDAQASALHLAEFVHAQLMPHLQRRVDQLRTRRGTAAARPRDGELIAQLDALVPEEIGERYLAPPAAEATAEAPPELAQVGLEELLGRLEQAPRGSRVILNPSNLTADEVLDVLYAGKGKITHLEVFNVKDWAEGLTEHRETIARIRVALNSDDHLQTRELLLEILRSVEDAELPRKEARVAHLRRILADIPRLHACYRHSHLKSRLGSDSTGRSRRSRGMGLVAMRSLPSRSRRRVLREDRLLPVRTNAQLQLTWIKRRSDHPGVDRLLAALRRVPLLRGLGFRRRREWVPEANSTLLAARGNIASLGGVPEHATNDFAAAARDAGRSTRIVGLRYLNTPTKNVLKVLIGFIPAFLTFYLTKDWWLLAYLGAVIWFAITGLRNIVQSVLGGGGLVRSPLLKWKDFVSWGRVADSLLFTGFSVPLLDYLVKTLLLARGLGVTTATSPLLLYTVIALANGVYISSHNVVRGLPAAAAVGNFFRTVLSIPLAVAINAGVAWGLGAAGVAAAEIPTILQLWAAVISKAASDMVAGVIEGMADRGKNIALRAVDFRDKRRQIRDVVGELAVLFPEEDVLQIIDDPKNLARCLQAEQGLFRRIAANALDCLYFWMLQPRGGHVFRRGIRRASADERRLFIAVQRVLGRKRELSAMCVEGMLGKQYDKALAFYLARADGYLAQISRLGGTAGRGVRRRPPNATSASP